MPALRLLVVQVATPPASVTAPHNVPPCPSPKSTVPVAVPGVTAALVVNGWPAVNVVVQAVDRSVVVEFCAQPGNDSVPIRVFHVAYPEVT